jgi:hypothetical protein
MPNIGPILLSTNDLSVLGDISWEPFSAYTICLTTRMRGLVKAQ